MKHIKKFNERRYYEDRPQPKVKHLIEYLQSLDPEMDIFLDKDGWEGGDTEVEMIEQSGVFYVSSDNNSLTINN